MVPRAQPLPLKFEAVLSLRLMDYDRQMRGTSSAVWLAAWLGLGFAWLNCVPDAHLASLPVGPGGAGGSGTGGVLVGGGGAGDAGGAGGVGGFGGAGGVGDAGGGPVVLATFESSSPNLTSYTYDNLGGWLLFKSPNPGNGSGGSGGSAIPIGAPERTSQIGPSTLRRGYATADVARARNVDGSGWGLNIESERTNKLRYSDDMKVISGGWINTGGPSAQTYMAAIESQTDPAGGTKAVEFTIDDCSLVNSPGQWSPRYIDESGGAMSIWAIGDSGGELVASTKYFSHFWYGNTSVPLTSDMQWTRLKANISAQPNQILFTSRWNYGGSVGEVCISASTFRAFGAQLEDDEMNYVSSYIPTQASPVTRAAERLYTTQVSTVAPDGYYHARLVFRPRYASGEQQGTMSNHKLLHFDIVNSVYIKPNPSQFAEVLLCQRAGNSEGCSGPLTWSAEQELTVNVKHTASGRELTVSGADQATVSLSWGAETALAAPLEIHILSQPTGATDCAELRSITFYQP